jgi:hypothetical protein
MLELVLPGISALGSLAGMLSAYIDAKKYHDELTKEDTANILAARETGATLVQTKDGKILINGVISSTIFKAYLSNIEQLEKKWLSLSETID